MSIEQTQILSWNEQTRVKYEKMIRLMPTFHRDIAKQVVDKKAVLNAQERGSQTVEEQDVVRAFFSEVPLAFYSLMIRLLEHSGFDYKKYEP